MHQRQQTTTTTEPKTSSSTTSSISTSRTNILKRHQHRPEDTLSKYEPLGGAARFFLLLGALVYHVVVLFETRFLGRHNPELTPRDSCIFCNCQTEEYQRSVTDKNQILYRDETCFVIADYRPKGKVHYLVIPLQHVQSVKQVLMMPGYCHTLVDAVTDGETECKQQQQRQLERNLSLMEHLRTVALNFSRDTLHLDPSQVTLSFHVPPFFSINHLHLHITTDEYYSVMKRLAFYYDTAWCINLETVIRQLREKIKENEESSNDGNGRNWKREKEL